MPTLKERILELYPAWMDVQEAKLALSNAERKLSKQLNDIAKEVDRLNLLGDEDSSTILIHQRKEYRDDNYLLLLRVEPPKYNDYPRCWIEYLDLLNPDVTTDIEQDTDTNTENDTSL